MKKQPTIDKVKKIARYVRKCCDNFVISSASNEYDFNVKTLECMCAVASYTLQSELYKKGIDTSFICS